ncbi:hypothetical protein ILYODFUR_004521, partial [Ilyodon furcidens]
MNEEVLEHYAELDEQEPSEKMTEALDWFEQFEKLKKEADLYITPLGRGFGVGWGLEEAAPAASLERFLEGADSEEEAWDFRLLEILQLVMIWSLEKQKNLDYVQKYKPENNVIRYLRVLLYGPVGAGKSSFINSVSNVLRGRMTIPALASATTSDKSFTTKYETHKLIKGREGSKTFYPVVFNDIMGLEDGDSRGVHADDIKLALRGHVKEGYKFNPVSPLTQDDPGYNPTPSADDRVHVLVCVMSANAPQIKSSVLEKM